MSPILICAEALPSNVTPTEIFRQIREFGLIVVNSDELDTRPTAVYTEEEIYQLAKQLEYQDYAYLDEQVDLLPPPFAIDTQSPPLIAWEVMNPTTLLRRPREPP